MVEDPTIRTGDAESRRWRLMGMLAMVCTGPSGVKVWVPMTTPADEGRMVKGVVMEPRTMAMGMGGGLVGLMMGLVGRGC